MTAHVSGAQATAHLAAIEACMSDRRGDQLEAIVPPEPDWRTGRDADVAACKEEDRQERQWRWFE